MTGAGVFAVAEGGAVPSQCRELQRSCGPRCGSGPQDPEVWTERLSGRRHQPLVTRCAFRAPQLDPNVQVSWLVMPPAQSMHMPLP